MKLTKHPKEPEVYFYFNTKDEKLWMFRHKYYDALGNRKEKKKSSFKTDRAAIQALMEVKAQTLRGEIKQFEYDHITVGQWLDIWYDTYQSKWKDTTRAQRKQVIKIHLKPLLGNYKLQTLDKTTYIRECIQVLKQTLSPNTVSMYHNIFKIAINAAVDDEILPRNRFKKVSLYNDDDIKSENDNYFSPGELVKFLDVAKQVENITNYTFISTVAYTGIRKGEALGLRWKNINFDNKTITIEQTRDHLGVRTPKTKNSYRTILVDDALIQQLETYLTWCKEKMLSLGKRIKENSFVFISAQTSDPVGVTTLFYAFKRVSKKTDLKGRTMHGLRHTHATILLNKGINVKVIAERLGNTPKMIYETYGHVLKEMEAQSVNIFSQSLIESGAKSGANK